MHLADMQTLREDLDYAMQRCSMILRVGGSFQHHSVQQFKDAWNVDSTRQVSGWWRLRVLLGGDIESEFDQGVNEERRELKRALEKVEETFEFVGKLYGALDGAERSLSEYIAQERSGLFVPDVNLATTLVQVERGRRLEDYFVSPVSSFRLNESV